MSWYLREVKGSDTLTIRRGRRADVAELLRLDHDVVSAGVGVVLLPSDLPTSQEKANERLSRFFDGDERERALRVAVLDGRVEGSATIERIPAGLCRHVASLGLQVRPRAQRRGLGRALLRSVLEWAEQHVEQVELRVRADNEGAIALYCAHGFEPQGRREAFVRLPDGRYIDDLVFARRARPGGVAAASS